MQPQCFLAGSELFPLGASAAWERVVPTEKPTRLWAGKDTSLPVRIDLTVRAAIARRLQEPKPMRRTSRPCARFSCTTWVKASSVFSASFRLRPERAAIWWASSPLPTMCSVAICLCSSFVCMGRTKSVPCPSALFLSVVPTQPYYLMVSVVVKDGCLLLGMFLTRHGGAGLARPHLLVLRTGTTGSHHPEAGTVHAKLSSAGRSLPSAPRTLSAS